MRRIRKLSISSRITVGSLIVAALLGLVAVLVVRVGVASILHNATVTLLTNDSAPYVASIQADPKAEPDPPVEGQLIAVISPDGQVVRSSLPRGLDLQIQTLRNLPIGVHDAQTFTASYLIMIDRVPTSQGTFEVITARNDETAALILTRLTDALVGGAIGLVICLGAASWLLARTALRPVNRMRARAQAIAEDSSTGLLPVGPAQDELAALATTLNDLIGRLRASAEREKQLVSDASHELRTPIAVLQGQLELAQLDAGNAESLLSDVRSSHATVLRLSQLATNLLELSRIEAAESAGATDGRSSAETADWRALTEELADSIDRARGLVASTAAVTIDFDYRPRVSKDAVAPVVALSARDFARILDNLLSNAVRAVDPRGTVIAELTISHDEVVLEVSDSGAGMPAEFIPVALDRFTRADASRTAYSGGGLGLAIVAALVSTAGGTILLENDSPGGLLVTITLPTVPPLHVPLQVPLPGSLPGSPGSPGSLPGSPGSPGSSAGSPGPPAPPPGSPAGSPELFGPDA